MTLYRAVCKDEYDATSATMRFHRNREKAFGTLDFVKRRVLDGRFNGSAFKPHRYTHLLRLDFDPHHEERFHKRGPTEWVVNVRRANFPYTITKLGTVHDLKGS